MTTTTAMTPRKAKTVAKISEAARDLKAEGLPVNARTVSERAGTGLGHTQAILRELGLAFRRGRPAHDEPPLTPKLVAERAARIRREHYAERGCRPDPRPDPRR